MNAHGLECVSERTNSLDQGKIKLRLCNPRFLRTIFATLAILSFLNLTARSQAFATESILWSFGNGTDGTSPRNLIIDTSGNLYATTVGGTYGGGTVFELTPPSTIGGNWTESVPWSFGNGIDGKAPSGLTMDTRGNLYGTTQVGGTNSAGTVFELSPDGLGGWNEKVLYDFGSVINDGSRPSASMIIDGSGNLYGATVGGAYGGGTVFELTPPSVVGGGWTEAVLYSFGGVSGDGKGPNGPIMDASGNIFGTTASGGAHGAGTVFELSPVSGGGWKESILWSVGNGLWNSPWDPQAGVIMDASGNLYGTTWQGGAYYLAGGIDNGGTVFKLTKPTSGGTWTGSTIWNFGNTKGKVKDGQLVSAVLLMDANGTLYGTTTMGGQYSQSNGGTVFKLTPPAKSGSGWTETVLWSFGYGTDGNSPSGVIKRDSAGNICGTTTRGGANNYGTVFKITP